MKEFLKSKLYGFLSGLVAYLAFFIQWASHYMAVWYANIPDETQYFQNLLNKRPTQYLMYIYILAPLFLLYLVFGILFLVKNGGPKWVNIFIVIILSLSATYVWYFSVAMKGISNLGVMFINLVLFVIAIYSFLNKNSVGEIKKQVNTNS